MKHAVSSLAGTYDKVRSKARRKLEEKRQKQQQQRSSNKNSIKNSETLILLKALVKDQKSTIVLTGFLRLLNTAIQAFPSLLVARLLRSIEAGPTVPVQESLKAAVALVGVLCVKLIIENQFFLGVVNMSMQVRGTLEGLIFDKSLRLPEGGSGVLIKQDGSEKSSANQKSKTKPKKALGSGGVSGDFVLVCFRSLCATRFDTRSKVTPDQRAFRIKIRNCRF